MIFLSLGILSFVVNDIVPVPVPVPFIRSVLSLVFLMSLQSLTNSFASERFQVGPSGPVTSLLIFPCFLDTSVKY